MADNRDLSAVIEAGKRIGDPKLVEGGGAYTILGTGDQVHDLEHLLDTPRRVQSSVTAHDPDTFVAYFNAFKFPGESVIFADRDNVQLIGVIDYHHESPAWCSHQVIYTAPHSPEWLTWTGKHGRSMTQPDFAQFIENNVDDIREPSGAEMLEVSRSLQAKKSVDFSSAIRLATGEQEFTYAETIQGSAGKGKLKVPEVFKLGIPVFVNDAPYEVTARLRYRINEGKLSLWYDLLRHPQIEVDAFMTIIGTVATATAVAIWHGRP